MNNNETKEPQKPLTREQQLHQMGAQKTAAASIVTGIQERQEESKEAMEERKRLEEEEKEKQERLARALAMQKPTLSAEEAALEEAAAKRDRGIAEPFRKDLDVMHRPEQPAEETSDKK